MSFPPKFTILSRPGVLGLEFFLRPRLEKIPPEPAASPLSGPGFPGRGYRRQRSFQRPSERSWSWAGPRLGLRLEAHIRPFKEVVVILIGLGKLFQFIHETHGVPPVKVLVLAGGVDALSKDGGAHAHHIGAAGYSGLIVAAHAHGQKAHRYIIVFFHPIVNKKLLQ